MSDTIQPNQQGPIPCDFGPFAGKKCMRSYTPTLDLIESNITASAVTKSVAENVITTIDLSSYVTSVATIDWSALTLTAPSEGTYSINGSIVKFTPDETINTTRTITVTYTVTDSFGATASNTIKLTVADKTPYISANNFTISLLDTATKTITITSKLTIRNDSFASVVFDEPSEGTINVSGSSVTFTPDETVAGDRSLTINYTATTATGLTSNGVMTINISDDNIWAGSIWYGNSTLDTMTQEGIIALSDTSRQQTFPGTYSFGSGTGVYKWIVYPSDWGEPLAVIDPTTNFEVPVDDYTYLTVEGVELIMIRTWYQLNGSISIKLV